MYVYALTRVQLGFKLWMHAYKRGILQWAYGDIFHCSTMARPWSQWCYKCTFKKLESWANHPLRVSSTRQHQRQWHQTNLAQLFLHYIYCSSRSNKTASSSYHWKALYKTIGHSPPTTTAVTLTVSTVRAQEPLTPVDLTWHILGGYISTVSVPSPSV